MQNIVTLLIASLVLSCVYSEKGKVKKEEETLDLTPQEQKYFLAKFEYFHYLKTNKIAKTYLRAMKKATDYDEKKSKEGIKHIELINGCYTKDQLNREERKLSKLLLATALNLFQQPEYCQHQDQIREYAIQLSDESKLKIAKIFEANEQNAYKKKITIHLKQKEKDDKLLQKKVEESRNHIAELERCHLNIPEIVLRSRRDAMIDNNIPNLIVLEYQNSPDETMIPRQRAGAMTYRNNPLEKPPLKRTNSSLYFF